MQTFEEIAKLKLAKEQAERDGEKARVELKEREEALEEMKEKVQEMTSEMQKKEESFRREMEEMRAHVAAMQKAMRGRMARQAGDRSAMQEPEKLRKMQQQILLYLHTDYCLYVEKQSHGKSLRCDFPYCKVMKNILAHLASCEEDLLCTVQHCCSTRHIVGHWKSCKKTNCPLCAPVRKTEEQWRSCTGKAGQAPLIITAAADSQSSPNAEADGEAVIESNLPEDVLNEDGGPVSPSISVGLENEDITVMTSRTPKEWHDSISTEFRKENIKKLILSIVPSRQLPSVLDRSMYSIVLYSQIVEGNIFEEASSSTQYWFLVSEKARDLQYEMEEKRRKRSDQPTPEGAPPLRLRKLCAEDEQVQQHRRQLQNLRQPEFLQSDSLLDDQRRNELQRWYMHQRLMLFQRRQQQFVDNRQDHDNTSFIGNPDALPK